MRKASHEDGQIEWIKEAFKSLQPPPKGWVTVYDIEKQTGQKRTTISQRVNQMVNDGILDVRDCLINGRIGKCYKKK